MKVLITGSAGHLGEALARTLRREGHETVGVDLLESPFTDITGSIAERSVAAACVRGVDAVLHAATLHKPHIATHSRQDFVDTNITGTLNLLEETLDDGVGTFVFTSTTSVFGRALRPPAGAPAAWVTEELRPIPKNIYGVTKAAAEDLCELFHRDRGMSCLVLRTSRFFLEADDDEQVREAYDDDNVKANEFLHRRVDLEDVVSAHLRAIERAPEIGFGRYVISATTPFTPDDVTDLHEDAAPVLRRLVPDYESEYERRGWRMFPAIDRVYVNAKARRELGWTPRYDFRYVLDRLKAGKDPRSELAREVGARAYHSEELAAGFRKRHPSGPYPVDSGG